VQGRAIRRVEWQGLGNEPAGRAVARRRRAAAASGAGARAAAAAAGAGAGAAAGRAGAATANGVGPVRIDAAITRAHLNRLRAALAGKEHADLPPIDLRVVERLLGVARVAPIEEFDECERLRDARVEVHRDIHVLDLPVLLEDRAQLPDARVRTDATDEERDLRGGAGGACIARISLSYSHSACESTQISLADYLAASFTARSGADIRLNVRRM
jgi:uncharacterized protein (DUF58 family)